MGDGEQGRHDLAPYAPATRGPAAWLRKLIGRRSVVAGAATVGVGAVVAVTVAALGGGSGPSPEVVDAPGGAASPSPESSPSPTAGPERTGLGEGPWQEVAAGEKLLLPADVWRRPSVGSPEPTEQATGVRRSSRS